MSRRGGFASSRKGGAGDRYNLPMIRKPFLIIALLAISAIALTALLLTLSINGTDGRKISTYIKTTKIGDKVLLISLGYDAVIAIASQKGIIMVDAGMSHSLAAKYRRIIEAIFGRNDFVYLLNTHSHQDHTGGNQVFPEAMTVGHQNCPPEMSADWGKREEIRRSLGMSIDRRTKGLKELRPGSEEWKETFCKRACWIFALDDMNHGRKVTPPKLTFSDSLSLPAGDLTIDLFYFGPAHSRSDILIHIPELGLLLTGDIFSKGGYPSLDRELLKEQPVLRERAVKWLLSRWNEYETIIGGHGEVMNKADLEYFLDCLKGIDLRP